MEEERIMDLLDKRESIFEDLAFMCGYYGPFMKAQDKPLQKVRLHQKCINELSQWTKIDAHNKEAWCKYIPTEEYEQAVKREFKDYIWICPGQQQMMEYLFKIEWVSGTWPQKKVDMELVDPGMQIDENGENINIGICHVVIAEFLKINDASSEEYAAIRELVKNAPVIIARDVELRKAKRLKRLMGMVHGAKIILNLPMGDRKEE